MGSKPTHDSIDRVDGYIIPPPFSSDRYISEMKHLKGNTGVQSCFRYEKTNARDGKLCIDGYLLPQSEPYRQAEYKVRIILNKDFPFQPPELRLITPMYHRAVNEDISKPKFCRCIREGYSFKVQSPSIIRDLIRYYINAIDQPKDLCWACDVNHDALRLYYENRALYQEKASEIVRRYAGPR